MNSYNQGSPERVVFTNSLSDYLAFGERHYRTSIVIKRARYITQGIPILLFLYFAGLYLFGGHQPSMFFWMFLALAFLVFTRIYHKKNYLRRLTAMYREGMAANPSDPIELLIDDDGLRIKAGSHTGMVTWSQIEQIDSIPSHTFIYTGPIVAVIIPRAAVTEGQYDNFTGELKTRFDRSRATR